MPISKRVTYGDPMYPAIPESAFEPCLPDTAIETLEAVRLFLFTDHTAFVHPERSDALAEVYRRGLAEVGMLLQGIKARPN